MSKHLCHWTRKDMYRVVLACKNLNVGIEHIIALTLLPERLSIGNPLEDLFDDAEKQELEAIFGGQVAEVLYSAETWEDIAQYLHRLGGFLVFGYFRPPDKNRVSLDAASEVRGYTLAPYERPCRAWAPCLHTAIGKCLSQAARIKRNILREGREIALRKGGGGAVMSRRHYTCILEDTYESDASWAAYGYHVWSIQASSAAENFVEQWVSPDDVDKYADDDYSISVLVRDETTDEIVRVNVSVDIQVVAAYVSIDHGYPYSRAGR